jgi:hypothetical protein
MSASDSEKVAAAILTQARFTALGAGLQAEVTKMQAGTVGRTLSDGAKKLTESYYTEMLEFVHNKK